MYVLLHVFKKMKKKRFLCFLFANWYF